MPLTPRQQLALDHTRHIAITANAGSGKTRVLVERYLRLVIEGHAEVAEIVALTFTEKAAGELKRKIAEQILETEQRTGDPRLAARLEIVRAQLPGAVIGTIHSFCAMLLREHPVEAEVDAAFGVIEGLDQRLLLEEAVRGTFHNLLRQPGGEAPDQDIITLLARMGKSRVVAFVTALVEQRDQVQRWCREGGVYGGSDQEVLEDWDRHIRAFLRQELSSRLLQQDLEDLLRAGKGRNAPRANELHVRFTEARDLAEQAGLFAELLEVMITLKGELQKAFAGADVPTAMPQARRLKRWKAELQDLLAYCGGPSQSADHVQLLAWTRLLLNVAAMANDRYERMKLELGQLDFEDLQLKTQQLLRDENLRRHSAGRFKYVMVDEYQDTNRLQYEILLPLLNHLASGNLFVVGDPKQSIYRFRGADVRVFNRTRNDIIERGGESSDVVLEESFRPLRAPLAFVNLVFAQLMGDSGAATAGPSESFEIPYNALIQARAGSEAGRVELLLGGGLEGGYTESERIARRILRLTAGDPRSITGEGAPSPVRFRDIAILLRSRSMMPSIEEAFLRFRIPFVVTAGVGYFQTQDILDFYNYCMFLLNPADDVSLVGVLRSPFFGISDPELAEHALGRRDGSFWNHLEARSSSTSPHVRRAVTMLREDLEVGLTLSVPDLFARILRRTGYVNTLSGTSHGRQALANLEKLRLMARTFDQQGFSTLYDFTQRLRRLIDEEEREGQGEVASEGNAVQIMTIHAAKGLEFPVVILPHLHQKFRYDSEPYLDEQLGLGVALRSEGAEKEPLVPVALLMKEHARRATLAEEKRILYVGMTRAQDILILSGEEAAGSAEPTPLGWIVDALGGEQILQRPLLEFRCSTGVLVHDGTTFHRETEEHLLALPILRDSDLTDVSVLEAVVEPVGMEPLLMVAPLPAQTRGEIFSVTKVRTYLDCPARYYLRYVLGLPEEPVRDPADDEREERDSSSALQGRVFHAVMQQIDRIGHDRVAVVEAAGLASRREMLGGEVRGGAVAERVAETVLGVIESPYWKSITPAREVRTEFTMTSPLGDDYIMGTVDRLFSSHEGHWNVLDYKTDAITEGDLPLRAREYSSQVQIYALLVKKFFGAETVRATLLFTQFPAAPVHQVLPPASLSAIEERVLSALAGIRRSVFPPVESGCRSCPFGKGVCNAIPLRS